MLEGAAVRPRQVNKGVDILLEGDRPPECTVLLEGYAGRYNLLRNGKRQITALHLPGDFVDLDSFLVKRMDHAAMAITPCTVGVISHDSLREISENHPHLARLLWLTTLVDGAINRRWLVAMGRRSALEHTAYLLCELFVRLEAVGLVTEDSFKRSAAL